MAAKSTQEGGREREESRVKRIPGIKTTLNCRSKTRNIRRDMQGNIHFETGRRLIRMVTRIGGSVGGR